MSSDKRSVIIVGGGVIGLCSALYAMREGFAVTLIDRQAEEDDSCSTGNAGMVVPSHFVPLAAPGMVSMGLKMMFKPKSPFRIKPRPSIELISWMWKFMRSSTKAHVDRAAPVLSALNLGSRQAYAELADEFDFGLQQRGLLMLCKTAAMLEHEASGAREAPKYGIEAQVLSAEEAAKLDPNIKNGHPGRDIFSAGLPSRSAATAGRAAIEVAGWGSCVGFKRRKPRVGTVAVIVSTP